MSAYVLELYDMRVDASDVPGRAREGSHILRYAVRHVAIWPRPRRWTGMVYGRGLGAVHERGLDRLQAPGVREVSRSVSVAPTTPSKSKVSDNGQINLELWRKSKSPITDERRTASPSRARPRS